MVKQLHGLLDSKDLNAWENGFVRNIFDATNGGDHTSILSDERLEKIQEIWDKHFS